MKQSKAYMTVVHIFLILWTAICILPLLMVVSVSFTDELTFVNQGFSFIPKKFSLDAWKAALSGGSSLVRATILTIVTALIGPFLSNALSMMIAYPMSRPDFAFKKPLTFFYMLPMFISGGMVASYILIMNWLHLGDNVLLYILPSTGFYAIVLYRSCFKQVPASLIEAATIDGATEYQILWKVTLPMSRSIFVIQYFMGAIGSWNDYTTSLLYFSKPELFKIQYLIFKMLKNAQAVKQALAITGLDSETSTADITLSYAMCVVAILPVILVFPLIQKYFAKGVAAGAIKE